MAQEEHENDAPAPNPEAAAGGSGAAGADDLTGREHVPEGPAPDPAVESDQDRPVPAAELAEPDEQAEADASGDDTEPDVPESDAEHGDEADHPENYHTLSKEEMVGLAEAFCNEPDYAAIRARIAPLKEAFTHLVEAEREARLEKHLEDGGEKEDFDGGKDELEKRFGRAMRRITRQRHEFIEAQERQRAENLRTKQEILDQLKELIQNEENMSRAFNTFHDLQARWRSTGPVPQQDAKDLWLSYSAFTEQFYNYIKLNRELQELDQRKNLEMKISLCEQVEELHLEPVIGKALQKLLSIQNTWREVGSVPRDRRTEIGERYKAACDALFERKKEYTRETKDKQQENARLKTGLCEKAEALAPAESAGHKEVMEHLKTLRSLQAEWRTVGFAGTAANDDLWKRFKAAVNAVYKAKNEFFASRKKEWQGNLQAKTELCIQAEALAATTDWKKGGQELRRLHDEWKKIGYAGNKVSDQVWERFKAASDGFYESRNRHFEKQDEAFEANLEKKSRLIERIEAHVPGEDKKENLDALRAYQREWSETGMVPIKKKDDLYNRYRKAVDGLFGKMKIGQQERQAMQFREKIEHLKSGPDSDKRLFSEKKHLMNKLSHLQGEVATWENNLGFFAKSKNAEAIIREFEEKIARAKEEIGKLRQQLEVVKKG